MGLPIVSEIWDGIRWIIDFFINKSPKPIKILLFLLFLLLFGSIISFFLHLSGIHCTTEKEVVKNDVIDIAGNMNLIWIKNHNIDFDENVTLDEVHPYRDIGFGICQRQYRQTNLGCYVACDNITDSDCDYYYTGGEECYTCNETTLKMCEETGSFFGSELFGSGSGIPYCSGDAYPKEWTWTQKWLKCNRRCEIPLGYKWDSDEGYYLCDDDDICGANATNRPQTRLDDALTQTGATLLYDNTEKRDYKKLITIKCTNNLNPELTFFGIPVFNYKIWLIIIVIAIMFIFLTNIKRH